MMLLRNRNVAVESKLRGEGYACNRKSACQTAFPVPGIHAPNDSAQASQLHHRDALSCLIMSNGVPHPQLPSEWCRTSQVARSHLLCARTDRAVAMLCHERIRSANTAHAADAADAARMDSLRCNTGSIACVKTPQVTRSLCSAIALRAGCHDRPKLQC